MRCTVYRSDKKVETYLYLAEGSEWEDLPDSLRTAFGEPHRVMDLDLESRERLAREDIATVRQNLEQQGFHLQMPPELTLEEQWS